jgi:CRISPR-associated Csx2 family protein
MTTLLTFVGRTAANRDYRFARYRFDDGIEVESKLFAAAALSWLRRTGRAPDRLLVVGTPTSGWDVLMELVERLAPVMSDDALAWAVPVSETLASGPVETAMLREFESRFSSALGLRVELVLSLNDGDSVFAVLDAALTPDERVILDITHSFRTMPVHALVALGAMRWLKGVELVDILYGSLDEKGADGASAARSLGATARLAHATPALAQLALMDDVGGIAPYLAESTQSTRIAPALADTQRLESIMQFDNAGARRGQALGELRALTPQACGAAATAVAVRTRSTLESLNLGNGSLGLINRARRALDRGDYMRAVGLSNEALTLKVVELHDLRRRAREEVEQTPNPEREYYATINRLARGRLQDATNREGAPMHGSTRPYYAWRALNDARNAVMHSGTGLADQAPPRDLLSPEALRSLLEWSFRFYDFLS